MTSWKYVEGWVEDNPTVKKWLFDAFTKETYRADYASHLMRACNAIGVKPEAFLKFLNGKPSALYTKTRQYLMSQSTKYVRKGHLERAAIQSYVRFHNDRPVKFTLAVQLKNLPNKYDRPRWGMKELQKLLENIHRKYRPLIRLGAYCGFGRKELCYLNEHFSEVKPVPNVPEAVYLTGMPARKSSSKLWTAILPAEEFEEYKKHAPVTTFIGRGKAKTNTGPARLVTENDLTQNVKNACIRAEIREKGTNTHVLRSIFKTIGLSQPSPNIKEDYLDLNMGHTDVQNYDRRNQDIEGRAKAMVPLWEFMRSGPAVATRDELTAMRKELDKLHTYLMTKEDFMKNVKPGEFSRYIPPATDEKS